MTCVHPLVYIEIIVMIIIMPLYVAIAVNSSLIIGKLKIDIDDSAPIHSKKDLSAQEFHGLFTESFQPVSKFGK